MLRYVLDVIIAELFILSFVSKIHTIPDFKTEIISYRLLPMNWIPITAFSVLFLEFVLFNLYCIGLFYPWKEIVGFWLILAFTLATIKKRRTGDLTCRCFGTIRFLNKYPAYRNASILFVIVISMALPPRAFSLFETMLFYGLVTITALLVHISQLMVSIREMEGRYERFMADLVLPGTADTGSYHSHSNNRETS